MRRLVLVTLTGVGFLITSSRLLAQSIGIGTSSPHPAAQLEINSTSKGLLIPRMTQIELNAIASPPQGLVVFNTNSNSFQFFNGVMWNNLAHSGIINDQPNRIGKFTGIWGMSPGLMLDNGSGISINTAAAADASALLDMVSTSKGVLLPRMTSTERTTITAPAKGLLVFDNTTSTFWFHNGSSWVELTSGGGGAGSNWTVIGNDIYNSNSGNVGIGASSPFAKLTVDGNTVISGGISAGTATPDLVSYKMDINGNARVRQDQYINRDLWVDRNFDVDGTSNLLGNIIAGGNLSIGGDITSVDNVDVLNNLTVDNGKGIVRSANGSQRVVTFPSGSVGFPGAGGVSAGYTADVTFALSNVYASTPIISLGQMTNVVGPVERWTFMIHSVDIVNDTFLVRFYTPTGTGAATSFTLNFIAIGTAL